MTPSLTSESGEARIWPIQGDARHLPLADGIVQCVVTSPPYWALRDYGHDGADWDAMTYRTIGGKVSVPAMRCPLGLEPTPDAFVGHMLTIFREVWRVLRDDGVCWMNIGDSYNAGTSKPSGASKSADVGGWTTRSGDAAGSSRTNARDLKVKDLVGIPWMLAFALRADGWSLRQDVIWHKPNPMPESTRDRCTKAHEYLFLLTKRQRYYFDNEAIKVPATYAHRTDSRARGSFNGKTNAMPGREAFRAFTDNANKRSVWSISTESCRDAHFATYPTKLVTPCILAGTSAKGCCPACRAPWSRVVDKVREATRPGDGSKVCGRNSRAMVSRDVNHPREWDGKSGLDVGNRDPRRHVSRVVGETWVPGCACNAGDPVPCLVLDPFHGAGTTAIVAKRLGRAYVGTELSTEYLAISQRRIAADKPARVKKTRVPRAVVGQLALSFTAPPSAGREA